MSGGRAKESFLERTRAATKIVVVDFGFLGDSVHLVPALWEIKRNYAGAQLHTVSATVGAEMLKLAPCVDQAWAFPLTEKSPAWWKHWDILWALRRERYEVAFNFSGSDRSIFATAAIGACWALGYEAGRKHFWNRWLVGEWVERGTRETPVFEQRRQVLAASGFTLQATRFDLRVPAAAQQWAAGAVAAGSVHLSINASTAVKEWPLENWIGLARRLLTQDASVQLAATASAKPREVQRLRELARAVDSPRLRCLEGTTISQVAAVLERCRLQIGADSGVLHLAVALGVPTLTVFREYAGLKEWMPRGEEHRYFLAGCRCINENRSDCLAAGRASCLAGITAEQVAAQAMQQLG
ncbi:MAG: glycosyltransferase family 9 protein [Verrucomicrobiota bacterium]|jgi:ADP-heptose:LPS heptosyltransferase